MPRDSCRKKDDSVLLLALSTTCPRHLCSSEREPPRSLWENVRCGRSRCDTWQHVCIGFGGRHNKLRHTRWPKTTDTFILSQSGVRKSKIKVSAGWFLQEAPRKAVPGLSPRSWWSPQTFRVFTEHSLCVSLRTSLFLEGHRSLENGPPYCGVTSD